MPEPDLGEPPAWSEFASDCARCAGLCCTALPFARSREFAADKPAGLACTHLETGPRTGFACRIHDRLRVTGWVGCTVFECFGAGQRVTSGIFGGRPWTQEGVDAAAQFATFEVMRVVQEIRYYCRTLVPHEFDGELRTDLARLESEAAAMAGGHVELTHAGAQELRGRAAAIFRDASALLRQGRSSSTTSHGTRRHRRVAPGADLVGADLREADLSGCDLRGTLLIGADLGGARLDLTDVLGADVRDADVRGADLRTALFLTQAQVNAARGDDSTTLPAHVGRPGHWQSTTS